MRAGAAAVLRRCLRAYMRESAFAISSSNDAPSAGKIAAPMLRVSWRSAGYSLSAGRFAGASASSVAPLSPRAAVQGARDGADPAPSGSAHTAVDRQAVLGAPATH